MLNGFNGNGDINDLLWQMFASTGDISYFLLRNRIKEDKKDVEERQKR